MTHAKRGGFGIATLSAVMVPALVLVVAVAHMFQATTTRRLTSTAYGNYLGGEVAESAIAEAAHLMSVGDMFPGGGTPATFTDTFVQQMLSDQPAQVPQDSRAYFALVDAQGQEISRMLVAMAFDGAVPAQEIRLQGIAKAAAEANPGVKVLDMKVLVKPISFRREFISARNQWVNWGVVAFQATVTLDDGLGVQTHGQTALKIFSLRPSGQPGDVVVFSDRNLRTLVSR